ncbi:MAG TPA: OmpA family protein [Kofleriaceae bacterium]|nr:OmpA family protein [Kofleriaceae bacterium]
MRFLVLAIILIAARVASAQPVAFELHGDVQQGQKPQLQVRAQENVTDVKLALDRSDGKHFEMKQASIAKGKAVVWNIGDGAAGKMSYKGTLSAKGSTSGAWTEEMKFDTVVRAPLKVGYDADHLDLDKRQLQFKPTRTGVTSAEITVIGDDGKELAKNSATYDGTSSDWLTISWKQATDTQVMMLKLRVETSDGAATNLELIPWSVSIDHEDVNFKTDSSKIEDSETKKLDASLVKIQEVMKKSEKFMKMKLYVAGHTDTVGAPAKNRTLSLARAQSITAYFKKKGLTIPIAFAGFGEDVLKVKTADNTDEAANRRADYVLGPAAGAPPFKGAYLKAKVQWKQLR